MLLKKMNKINVSYNCDVYWIRFNGSNHKEITDTLDLNGFKVGTKIEKDQIILNGDDFYIELKKDDILLAFDDKNLQILNEQEFNIITFFLSQLDKSKENK